MNANLDFTTTTLHAPRQFGRQIVVAGFALTRKVQEQVAVSGALQAACNLRKQGYPLQLALALVAGRV